MIKKDVHEKLLVKKEPKISVSVSIKGASKVGNIEEFKKGRSAKQQSDIISEEYETVFNN